MSIADGICYYREDRWVPLPPWGGFFLSIGHRIAETAPDSDRFVLGVSVPIRAYAAALAAVGVVLSRSKVPVATAAPEEHFEQLCGLKKNTPLIYVRKGRKLRGVFQGVDTIRGVRRIRVMVESGSLRSAGTTHCLDCEQSVAVEVDPCGHTKLPDRQTGRCILPKRGLLTHIVGENEAIAFSTRSRIDCLIVGRVGILRDEITKTPFATKSRSGGTEEGNLQNVLRARKFMGEGQAYRSNVIAMNTHRVVNPPVGELPYVTIFDGANGFLTWRDCWRDSHWIVILDQTEPAFREAADALNREYVQKRRRRPVEPGLPYVPPRVETLLYREVRR